VPDAASTLAKRVTITRVVPPGGSAEIAGVNISHPQKGSGEARYSFPLAGWVVPARMAATEIHIFGAQSGLPRVPVAIERPDIAELHPELPWAASAGFAARLSTIPLPRRFRLVLSLRLGDGTSLPFGEIEGERAPLPGYEEATYRPLLVTTLGRSGSTWLTWLLGRHPEIADYRSFEYEPHVGGYFAEALRVLAQPSSAYQPIRGDVDSKGWWLGRDPRFALFWYSSHESVDEWLGTEYVEELVDFFARRIDSLYGRLAEAIGKPDATYFVEKLPPSYFAQRMVAEMLPGTREIFVVRDFRDVAASVFAFGRKRGEEWFTEISPEDDKHAIREPLRDDVMSLLKAWRERRDSALLVHYEDLVLRPEETLAEALAFLGLDARPEVVAEMLAGVAAVDGKLHQAHITSPTPADSIGRWRRDLSPALQRVCEEALGEGLQAFGYA
jgi:Sulfotransferase family